MSGADPIVLRCFPFLLSPLELLIECGFEEEVHCGVGAVRDEGFELVGLGLGEVWRTDVGGVGEELQAVA